MRLGIASRPAVFLASVFLTSLSVLPLSAEDSVFKDAPPNAKAIHLRDRLPQSRQGRFFTRVIARLAMAKP
jgi:hypothetical protein